MSPEEIKNLIDQKIKDALDTFKSNLNYDNFNVPYHIHNGSDSPKISQLFNYNSSGTTLTDILNAVKSVGLNQGNIVNGKLGEPISGNQNWFLAFVLENVIISYDTLSSMWRTQSF